MAARQSGRLSPGRGATAAAAAAAAAAAGAVRGESAPLAARHCPARPGPAGTAPPAHALPPAAGAWRPLWERDLCENLNAAARRGRDASRCFAMGAPGSAAPLDSRGEGFALPRPWTIRYTVLAGCIAPG